MFAGLLVKVCSAVCTEPQLWGLARGPGCTPIEMWSMPCEKSRVSHVGWYLSCVCVGTARPCCTGGVSLHTAAISRWFEWGVWRVHVDLEGVCVV